MKWVSKATLFCSITALLSMSTAHGQALKGTILGTITDATHAVMPSVEVRVLEVSKGRQSDCCIVSLIKEERDRHSNGKVYQCIRSRLRWVGFGDVLGVEGKLSSWCRSKSRKGAGHGQWPKPDRGRRVGRNPGSGGRCGFPTDSGHPACAK